MRPRNTMRARRYLFSPFTLPSRVRGLKNLKTLKFCTQRDGQPAAFQHTLRHRKWHRTPSVHGRRKNVPTRTPVRPRKPGRIDHGGFPWYHGGQTFIFDRDRLRTSCARGNGSSSLCSGFCSCRGAWGLPTQTCRDSGRRTTTFQRHQKTTSWWGDPCGADSNAATTAAKRHTDENSANAWLTSRVSKKYLGLSLLAEGKPWNRVAWIPRIPRQFSRSQSSEGRKKSLKNQINHPRREELKIWFICYRIDRLLSLGGPLSHLMHLTN